jgi:hypothetical protein
MGVDGRAVLRLDAEAHRGKKYKSRHFWHYIR